MRKPLSHLTADEITKCLPSYLKPSLSDHPPIELPASVALPIARKRFFRLSTIHGPDVHLTCGPNLQDLHIRSSNAHGTLPDLTCKPLFFEQGKDFDLIGQEFFEGQPIDECLKAETASKLLVTTVLEKLAAALESLEEPSSENAANEELDQFKELTLENDSLSGLDRDILGKFVFPRLAEALLRPNPTLRWSPGDLAPHNILCARDGTFKIIDFEFSEETHFHAEDWVRLGTYSNNQSFIDLSFVQDKLRVIAPGTKPFSRLRQITLNKYVHSGEAYVRHAINDLAESIWAIESKESDKANSLVLEGVALAKNEWMEQTSHERLARLEAEANFEQERETRSTRERELAKEKENRQEKELALEAERETRSTRERELAQEKENRLQKERTLEAEREVRSSRERELAQEKENRLQKEAELQTEKEIRQNIETHLAERIDKVQRMQNSFSWKVTAPLRMLRRFLHSFLPVGNAAVPQVTTAPSRSEDPNYEKWIRENDSLDQDALDRLRAEANIEKPANLPLFSIIMPVYETPDSFLSQAIESVLAQTYSNWELHIADDASPSPSIRTILQKYVNADSRIHCVFRSENGHISAASNSAAETTRGDFLVLLDHDDMLRPHALHWIAKTLARHPNAKLIYSDEDKINEKGLRFSPFFKPDWNPDLFLGQNYLCHLVAIHRSSFAAAGGFRTGFEGSQDWDLLLRISEKLSPEEIVHVPRILYHWRASPSSTALSADNKNYAAKAAEKALLEHFARTSTPAEPIALPNGYFSVQRNPDHVPPCLIIIPTRNGEEVLERCLRSIHQNTKGARYRILVVDNGSDRPRTLELLKELETNRNDFSVLTDPSPFNFSALNNAAAQKAQDDEVMVFLNDDTEVMEPKWLRELAVNAARPEIGAVGAKLLYPNGRIQHAGVILGIGGVAGHAFKRLPADFEGQMNRANLIHNVSAVTGACLAVEKEKFQAVDGFDEKDLTVAFNDIDFCLKLLRKGFRNLYLPQVLLTHHESYSRGPEDTPEKQSRFKREIQVMRNRWGDLLQNDPAYNPNLSEHSEHFELGNGARP